MEQRTLRLGDVVDDYCPRERRVTNHAIVAIVGDAIRQTRCTTCDADHVYKGGREPKRRKKDSTDALYGQVLSEVTGQLVTPRGAAADAPAESLPDDAAPEPASPPGAAPSAPALAADAADPDDTGDATSESEPNGNQAWWPGHRQLIRASLPRTDADPPPVRPIPEFTMHQRQSRGRGFGHGHGWAGNMNHSGNGHANGNHGNQNRDGNSWSGRSGHGGGQGQGPGQPRDAGGGRGRRRHRHRSNKPR